MKSINLMCWKEWLTVPLELSTVTVISSANSCLAFCGETTSNFPPVTAKVVKSVNLFIESWDEFCQLELVLERSINYMQYSTKNGIFTTSWNFYNDSFFQNQFTAVLAKRGSPKAMTGTYMWSFFTVYGERANNPEVTHQNGRRKKTTKPRVKA